MITAGVEMIVAKAEVVSMKGTATIPPALKITILLGATIAGVVTLTVVPRTVAGMGEEMTVTVKTILATTLEVEVMAVIITEGMIIDHVTVGVKTVMEKFDPKSALGDQTRRPPLLLLPALAQECLGTVTAHPSIQALVWQE